MLNRKTKARRRREIDEWAPLRQAFLFEQGSCWICGQRATDCHEMARGIHRRQAFMERICWFSSCNRCNVLSLDSAGDFPLARQLAYKWIHDREYFDLLEFNALRGRAPEAITFTEVIPWICRELDKW